MTKESGNKFVQLVPALTHVKHSNQHANTIIYNRLFLNYTRFNKMKKGMQRKNMELKEEEREREKRNINVVIASICMRLISLRSTVLVECIYCNDTLF